MTVNKKRSEIYQWGLDMKEYCDRLIYVSNRVAGSHSNVRRRYFHRPRAFPRKTLNLVARGANMVRLMSFLLHKEWQRLHYTKPT